MKKFLKKAEGFTLVELIVVIAILGILAGVAVPAYTGYLKKANQTADIAALDAIKTAATAALAEVAEVTQLEVTSASVKANNGTYDLTTASSSVSYDDDFKMYANSATGVTFKSKVGDATAVKATWTKASGEWVFS